MPGVEPTIMLTRDGANKIAAAEASAGHLSFHYLPSADLYVVKTIEMARDVRVPVDIPKRYQVLNWDGRSLAGQWMRQPAAHLNLAHYWVGRRPGFVMTLDGFRELLPGVEDPGNQVGLVITHDPELSQEALEAGASEFAGWLVSREGVQPIPIAVEPETLGLPQLQGLWPVDELAQHSVMVVGCGSIGGAAAESLAAYGVGRLELIDPDRLLWHNLIRHILGPESVGQLKVDALKTQLEERWPDLRVNPYPVDVVAQAHIVRSLFASVDAVVCAADGIAPRRVVSHLARRARRPAVLACVLDHGAIGEILRLRPTPRFGCLLCQRAALEANGAIDAEADQELAYGTGHVHQPMTAVPPDLSLVGALAAKIAVATLLESLHGDHTQRLPGEHALVGLRPGGDLKDPFDLNRAGEVSWHAIPPPRDICPTCSDP